MDNLSQIDPSLSQAPLPLSMSQDQPPSGQPPSMTTTSRRAPTPSKSKPPPKPASHGKAGGKTKGPVLQGTRSQLAVSKKAHKQAIRDITNEGPPAAKRTPRARRAKTVKAAPEGDGGKHFVHTDFENICSYLETAQHFTDLFGDGAKTSVGATKVSKGKAFDVFAVWMNQRNPPLQLTGRRLQQRFTSYKGKYMAAKHREDGTGGGVEEEDGDVSLAEVLEEMCPCFQRIDAIFREKANVTPMFEFDHSMMDATVDVDHSDASSQEIFFDDWEATQNPTAPSRATSPGPSLPAPANNWRLDEDDLTSGLPDLAQLFGGSGGAFDLPPAFDGAEPSATALFATHQTAPSPTRGLPPPHPTSAPATMLNPPGPAAPGSPMPQLAMVRQLSRGSRGGAPDPNARGTNALEPKSKMSLATSFAQANERKFDILNKQIATEARRWEEAELRAERERDREASKQASENALMDKRLNLEEARIKRQEDLEQAKATAALAKEDTLRNEKKAMVNEMLKSGQSSADIAALVRLVFG
ncbi:hypothetical protein PSTG_05123 [Puccinia striiformis f. sp. tritici PST-78]|uniref:Uncharacterized protein n=1 Tax=Puccinia striiformis f. sp. tritici PST-78 TaxID=1165861 RepID=A0A0L0VQZ5_9BASI|nr:hypothetical protein PSTG_05123 [Puccinia striiformis f. sp. tritici PST-78]